MALLNYNDFLFETISTNFETEAKKKLLIACTLKAGASIEERESLLFFIHEGFTDLLFDISSSLNEESFADKFKQMAAAAKEKIKEKGKDYANKFGEKTKAALKYGGQILSPLKAVLGKIGAILLKMWDIAKNTAMESVAKAKDKITSKVKGLLKDSDAKRKLTDEAGNLKSIGVASVKWATGGIVNSMSTAGQAAATTDESIGFLKMYETAFYFAAAETLNEGYDLNDITRELEIFESGHHAEAKGGIHIPFISAIMTKLAHMPPFSMFHKIEDAVAKSAEKGLNKFSILASKIADAPGPFKFPVIAGLVGIAAGYLAESNFKHGIIELRDIAEKALGFAIPGFGLIIKFMKYGGLALATYGVIQNLIGGEEKKKTEEPEETKEDGQENKE